MHQRAHVTQVHDWHANFAYFAASKDVIWVVTRLGWQVEGDGKTGLALSEVGAIQLVGRFSGGVARIGADQPRFVAATHTSRLGVDGLVKTTQVVVAGDFRCAKCFEVGSEPLHIKQ